MAISGQLQGICGCYRVYVAVTGSTYLPTFESQKTEHEILRGSEATEGGRVWEGGPPPPTVGSFCIFGLKIV